MNERTKEETIDDLDLVVKAQDKEFWDKVAEELKPTIKRALEETFEPTSIKAIRDTIILELQVREIEKKPTIDERYSTWLIQKKELEEKVLSGGPEAASAKALIQYNTGYFAGYKDALKDKEKNNGND